MTKITDIPAIRFKGFSDTWEQRKLGEMVIDHNAGIYISKEDYGEGTNVIGVGNIYDRDIFDGEIYRLGPVNDDKFILEENDIIYGESSLVPEGIARTVCVGKNGAGSAFAWHTRRVKLDKNIVNSHVATLELNYLHEIRKYLVSVSTQTALTGMTTEGYFGATLTLPSVEEQQVISDYFKNIDYLITLHQRKYDKLTNVKKSMLEKMFPQNGSNVPEIRFKGFTEAWEQRKLGEVAKYRNGKAHENCIDESGKYIVVNSKFVSTNGTVIKHSNMQNEPLAQNEIAFVLSDVPNGRAIARTFLVEENDKYTLNQRIAGITSSENTYPYFLHILMNRHPYFLAFDDGVKQTNLSVSDVLNFETYYPEYEEQKQIGEYFRNLDRLITLHQRELEKLKNLKKACLEKMFV